MLIVIDVEANGPCPGEYSMHSLGAVAITNLTLNNPAIFYARFKPITTNYDIKAYNAIGSSWEEHITFEDAKISTIDFYGWLKDLEDKYKLYNSLKAISDNIAFDWQFVNYYLHKYRGTNPMGYSGRRIGDIYSGATKKFRDTTSWKKMRKTKHTHNPVDDAMGNAEALIEMHKRGLINLDIDLK